MEASGKTEQPQYMQLLVANLPSSTSFAVPPSNGRSRCYDREENMNRRFYVAMQGPSEMGAGGRLVNWDRFNDLKRISADAGDLGKI